MIVPMGEAFRVEFSLDAMPDDNTFEAPSFEGFDVLAGPTVSRGQSVQIVNGSMTKRVEYTITYVLLPRQAGNATVGAASIQVDKRSYSTRALPIEVVDEGAAGGKGQPARFRLFRGAGRLCGRNRMRRPPLRGRSDGMTFCSGSPSRVRSCSRASRCVRPSNSTAAYRS